MVSTGQTAPDFTLTSDKGEHISLKALRGKPVVLYFCPRDEALATINSNCRLCQSRSNPYVIELQTFSGMLGA